MCLECKSVENTEGKGACNEQFLLSPLCLLLFLEIFAPFPLTLSQTTNFIPFKLKEFAEHKSKFDENERKFLKLEENTAGKRKKLLITSNFSFPHYVF